VQQGLTWTIQENTTANSIFTPGNFVVTVDDGTGDPGSVLLANVQTAIDAVRPVGSTFQVQGPGVVAANISLTVTAAAGYTQAQAVAAAGTALTEAVNAGGMGTWFMFGTIYQVTLNCPGIAAAESVTLNGGTADLTVTPAQVVRAGTIAVS
jgi:phage-related baseplate assembly protein